MILTFAGLAAYAVAARRLAPGAFAALSLDRADQLAVLEVALAMVTVVWPIEGVGFTFALRGRDLAAAAAGFAVFAAIAIPLGFGIGFIHVRPHPFDALSWLRRAFYFVFLVALPEELVFRGIVQNVLERRVFPGRWPLALGIAALIFGAAHLGHPPVPNWRYGMLAALAGVAYGWVWHRTRTITASALTHAAVDLVWVLALGGP